MRVGSLDRSLDHLNINISTLYSKKLRYQNEKKFYRQKKNKIHIGLLH